MTREEQINKMAKEVAAYLTYDKDIQVAFADVLKRGAEWADDHPDIDVRTMAAWKSGYQAAIERACEWLQCRLPLTNLDEFINEFKKAMKNEK